MGWNPAGWKSCHGSGSQTTSARGCCQHRLQGRGQQVRRAVAAHLPQPKRTKFQRCEDSDPSEFFLQIPNGQKSCWLCLQNHSESDLTLACPLPPAAPVHLIFCLDHCSSLPLLPAPALSPPPVPHAARGRLHTPASGHSPPLPEPSYGTISVRSRTQPSPWLTRSY